jgi:hypothetical protein
VGGGSITATAATIEASARNAGAGMGQGAGAIRRKPAGGRSTVIGGGETGIAPQPLTKMSRPASGVAKTFLLAKLRDRP